MEEKQARNGIEFKLHNLGTIYAKAEIRIMIVDCVAVDNCR